jgi:type VI secretion system protein ImpF
MAAPINKLQPCLLDRLTDDNPAATDESLNERVISYTRYKTGVLRDLDWLFKASAHLPEEGKEKFRLSNYPEAHRSVINFGTRHLFGLIAPNMEELERELVEALALFEPRLIRHTLSIKASIERHIVSFEISGELWDNQMPQHLLIKTKMDLENGQTSLGDAANG